MDVLDSFNEEYAHSFDEVYERIEPIARRAGVGS